MGAPAPVSPWIPEDDFLLKNAIEAGASLESLAKGAIKFSRRFTVLELQERWHSLLYDPVISAEASECMSKLQDSNSNISSKSNKFSISKETESVSGKRKEESVRRLYYAMKKRMCTETCSSVDLNFLVAPNLPECIPNGGCQEQLALYNENPNDMIGDPIPDDFELQDSDFDIVRHAFPQIGSGDQSFHSGYRNSFEGDIPDGIKGRDCLYGFAENVSPVSVNEAVGNNMGHSFEHDNVENETHILSENITLFDDNSCVQEIGPHHELALSTFDSITNTQENVCSEFGGSQDFSSPVSDSGASFDQLGFSSPQPAIPIWRTIEDIITPAMPSDENVNNKDMCQGDTSALPGAAAADDDHVDQVTQSGYDVDGSVTQLKEGESGDDLASSTAMADSEFMDLSDSLLNFTSEEVLLFMNDDDDDEKDMIDTSCLDGLKSILLGSPSDGHRDGISGVGDPSASVSMDIGVAVSDVACPVEINVIDNPLHSSDKVYNSDTVFPLPSITSTPNPHSPERRDGVICCILNTEDPEIPCNDDLFSPSQVLPAFVSSAMQQKSVFSSSVPSSTKDITDNRETTKQGFNLVNEERETPGIVTSQKKEKPVLPEFAVSHSIRDGGVKSELPENESLALSSRQAGNNEGDQSQCRSVIATQRSISSGVLEEGYSEVDLGRHSELDSSLDFLTEMPIHAFNHTKNQAREIIDGCKQEADVPDELQKLALTHAEVSTSDMGYVDPIIITSISDQEEYISEEDDDVPYFTDIETMILNMDLGPFDQESYLSKEEARYQHEDTKRTIIRLEQGVNSYMQRAIASHGAFALLYGRHLKHYIRQPEVVLGRATQDNYVDIDLGIEGRSSSISRRQATIKMEEDGSFYLKNLSNRPVSVNKKELTRGEFVKLNSSALIEVRGLRFLFEVNQNFVRQQMAKEC